MDVEQFLPSPKLANSGRRLVSESQVPVELHLASTRSVQLFEQFPTFQDELVSKALRSAELKRRSSAVLKLDQKNALSDLAAVANSETPGNNTKLLLSEVKAALRTPVRKQNSMSSQPVNVASAKKRQFEIRDQVHDPFSLNTNKHIKTPLAPSSTPVIPMIAATSKQEAISAWNIPVSKSLWRAHRQSQKVNLDVVVDRQVPPEESQQRSINLSRSLEEATRELQDDQDGLSTKPEQLKQKLKAQIRKRMLEKVNSVDAQSDKIPHKRSSTDQMLSGNDHFDSRLFLTKGNEATPNTARKDGHKWPGESRKAHRHSVKFEE